MSEAPKIDQFALTEYAELWRYYHKTLDMMTSHVETYFKTASIVGLVIAGTFYLSTKEPALIDNQLASLASGILAIGFAVVGLFVIVAFARELANSQLYSQALRAIRTALWPRSVLGDDRVPPIHIIRKLKVGDEDPVKNTTWARHDMICVVNSLAIGIGVVLVATGLSSSFRALKITEHSLVIVAVLLFIVVGGYLFCCWIGRAAFRRYRDDRYQLPGALDILSQGLPTLR